tara:strand:+ start:139 stop:294 length:156 start_codon:yes stop_codon:yes gene_type:complete
VSKGISWITEVGFGNDSRADRGVMERKSEGWGDILKNLIVLKARIEGSLMP